MFHPPTRHLSVPVPALSPCFPISSFVMLPPPRSPALGAAWMANFSFVKQHNKLIRERERYALHHHYHSLCISRSDLNVTPRSAPRSLHEDLQLQTLLPNPPGCDQPGGRLDNTVGHAGDRGGTATWRSSTPAGCCRRAPQPPALVLNKLS